MAAPGTEVAAAAGPAPGPGQVTSNGSAGGGEAAAAETQRQQPAPNAWQVIKGVLFRIFIIWAISSWFRRGPAPQEQSSAGGTPRAPSRNLFPKDTLMDLYVYISEHEHFTDFNVSSALFWQKRDLVYGDWTSGENADGCYEHYGEVDISQSVQQNGSIYIHVYFTKSGFHPDPRQKNLYRRLATVHTSRMINKYKRRRFQKTKNLLTGETEADPEMIKRAEDYGPVEVISHWHPNLTINMVDDHTPWVKGSVPPPLDQYVKFDAISGDYYPILYFNDYWNLQKDYFPINETLQRLPFRLSFCPLSLWRWQLYAAQSTKSPWNFLGEDLYEQSDEEQDSVKVALLETNPYLLALTIVVSIVHSIFEFLAFKNDIQFWNSRQSLEGLSVRSVFFGVFQSLVVLLYILDNETNFVVQVSVFIGLLIDLWKITKVMDVRLDRENKVAGVFPRVTFKDKSTYIESSTKVYDDMAFRYLSWILFPLLGCYAVYSLLYLEHKGWYSWVLSMLYGFLLTFGFITMTPQLFINYKLKSVAHLPWRMLTYKALNTFIDDLFAFVIKMPMMYRIGCLRDDVVFFIYLYQRWIYRVDLTRVNEFGVSGEDQVSPRPPCPAAPHDAARRGPPSPRGGETTRGQEEGLTNPPSLGFYQTRRPRRAPDGGSGRAGCIFPPPPHHPRDWGVGGWPPGPPRERSGSPPLCFTSPWSRQRCALHPIVPVCRTVSRRRLFHKELIEPQQPPSRFASGPPSPLGSGPAAAPGPVPAPAPDPGG
ncbi:putative lipid scramblase CLPTM1 [Ciconia boyciana]